eukprot:5243432-Prymnesium_polylepis.1
MAAARGAFKCRRGLGVVPSRKPAVVAHNKHEQMHGICIAVCSARASRGLVIVLVSGWPQKRESR